MIYLFSVSHPRRLRSNYALDSDATHVLAIAPPVSHRYGQYFTPTTQFNSTQLS